VLIFGLKILMEASTNLRDLTVNAPHGQRIIPELSLAIHVEGYMTAIRLTVVRRTGIILTTSVHEIAYKATYEAAQEAQNVHKPG
jgi:hypothetical protein